MNRNAACQGLIHFRHGYVTVKLPIPAKTNKQPKNIGNKVKNLLLLLSSNHFLFQMPIKFLLVKN